MKKIKQIKSKLSKKQLTKIKGGKGTESKKSETQRWQIMSELQT